MITFEDFGLTVAKTSRKIGIHLVFTLVESERPICCLWRWLVLVLTILLDFAFTFRLKLAFCLGVSLIILGHIARRLR